MAWRLAKLAIALGVVGFIWLVALPMAANTPRMALWLGWMEERGVDASAMYYTELDMMEPIFDRMALEKRK